MSYTILVIEDNVTWQSIIKGVLAKEGHIVETARTYNEAIQKIQNESFDIITVDLSLGPDVYGKEFEGFAVIKQILALNIDEYSEVIVITAFDSDAIGLKNEGIRVLSKLGFQKESLLSIIKVFSRAKRLNGQMPYHISEVDLNQKVLPGKSRILTFQLETSINDWKKIKGLYYPKKIEKFEKRIADVLTFSAKNNINLVVFPELSVPERSIPLIEGWSKENKDSVIVAGSHYWNSGNNIVARSPVIVNGEIHFTEKIYPSPHEFSPILGHGLQNGNRMLYFKNSILGNFFVLICSDNLRLPDVRSICLNYCPDFIIVPACQKDSYDHYSGMSDVVNNGHDLYYIYSNNLIKNFTDGRSAFFGIVKNENRDELMSYHKTDFIPKGKLCELKANENYYIIEADLIRKNPHFKNKVGDTPNIKLETGRL